MLNEAVNWLSILRFVSWITFSSVAFGLLLMMMWYLVLALTGAGG